MKPKEKVSDMTFEQIVRGMTFKEIVLAMIAGLRNRHVEIDMNSYGRVGWQETAEGKKEVCYGCAATNTICEIAGVKFDPKYDKISTTFKRSRELNSNPDFLYAFEIAIDQLRNGYVSVYNVYAKSYRFAPAPMGYEAGPVLVNWYYEDNLPLWEASVANL